MSALPPLAPPAACVSLSLHEQPAACCLLLLMAAVALAKTLRPLAFDSWNTFAGGSLQEILDGAWWQVITPAVTHFDLRHFLYNAFFFLSYACPLERLVGSPLLILLFFCSHVLGFLLKTALNRVRQPDVYMFIGGIGCSSATYFFAFFLLLARPNIPIAPCGHAFVCLALTYSTPPSAAHVISRAANRSNINVSAAAALAAAILLLCACISRLLPPLLPLSSYITLHFAAQALLVVSKRCRSRYTGKRQFDATDHTLHFMCASSGAALALCMYGHPRTNDACHVSRAPLTRVVQVRAAAAQRRAAAAACAAVVTACFACIY